MYPTASQKDSLPIRLSIVCGVELFYLIAYAARISTLKVDVICEMLQGSRVQSLKSKCNPIYVCHYDNSWVGPNGHIQSFVIQPPNTNG